MMNKKMGKTLLSTLSVVALSLSSATAIMASNDGTPPLNVRPIKAEINQEQVNPSAHFVSVKGTIQEISDYGEDKAMQLVTVKTSVGDTNRFVVSEDTYLADELAVGAEIIAFYDANLPVIMIYPPQYKAVAIALVNEGLTVKVDHFDENLISADGSLKLNLSEETEIILTDGTAYAGELTNRDLIVSYGPSTRSIPAQTTPEQIVVLPEGEEADPEQDQEAYASITGTIQEINEQLVTVQIKEDEVVHLVVSDTAYVDEELTVGAEIVAFYNANAPMTMIFPPRYNAEAVALVKKERSVMVDRFDETLLSADGSLRLKLTDETEVTTQDGEAFEGDLANRKLFVEYQVVALSFPGQTAPTRIVVLDEQEAPAEESSGVIITDLNNIEAKQWMINDTIIAAPSAFVNEQGTVMVPLRALAEALGYELTWEPGTMTAGVGKAISLQIGNEDYIFARMAPIQLGAAPALVDGLTYVPITFFKEVIRAEEVSVDAQQIVIRG